MKKRKFIFGWVIAGLILAFFVIRFLVGLWVSQFIDLVPTSGFVIWSDSDAGFMLALAFLIGFLPFAVNFLISTVLNLIRMNED
jgi:hypothetical protein